MPVNKENQIIVVLGSHRSGTSLTAKILSELGIQFGNDLIPGRSDNPSGFCEHRGILSQTKAIEEKLGIAPFHCGLAVAADNLWWEQETFISQKESLKKIIIDEVENCSGIFGFKDPRTIHLLPLWINVFSDLSISPLYILALRKIDDVIGSMVKRGIHPKRAEMVWACQMSYGLKHLQNGVAAVVSYEKWFFDAENQALSLLNKIGLGRDNETRGVREALDKVIRPELRHQRNKISTGRYHLSSIVRELHDNLYGLISEETTWHSILKSSKAIDDISNIFSPVIKEINHLPKKLESQVASKNHQLKVIRDELNKRKLNQARFIPLTGGSDKQKKLLIQMLSNIKLPRVQALRPKSKAPARILKVCFVSKNLSKKNIETKFDELSFLLADAGHEVTIVNPYYLVGWEKSIITKWTGWYQKKGVKFIPLDLCIGHGLGHDPDCQAMYALYRHIAETSYDIVHLSEMEVGFFCLQAKKLGLMFKDTIFCIHPEKACLRFQTRLTTSQIVYEPVKEYFQSFSIQFADLILIESMAQLSEIIRKGFYLPAKKIFLTSYAVRERKNILHGLNSEVGKRIQVNEIVFINLSESCENLNFALSILGKIRTEGTKFPKISIFDHFQEPEGSFKDGKFKIIHEFNHEMIIEYLSGGNRLAVILDENESAYKKIYELICFSVPFIAVHSKAVTALVKDEHREFVFSDYCSENFSNKIKEIIKCGGVAPAPNFDNRKNVGEWLNFHSNLSVIKDQEGWPPENMKNSSSSEASEQQVKETIRISICLVLDEKISNGIQTLCLLLEQMKGRFDVIIVVDGVLKQTEVLNEAISSIQDNLDRNKINLKVYQRENFSEAKSYNYAADKAKTDYLFFLNNGQAPRIDCVTIFSQVVLNTDIDVLTALSNSSHEIDSGFSSGCIPMIFVKRKIFKDLGGFDLSHSSLSPFDSFFEKAILNESKVEVLPIELTGDAESSGTNITETQGIDFSPIYLKAILKNRVLKKYKEENLVIDDTYSKKTSPKELILEKNGPGEDLLNRIVNKFSGFLKKDASIK